MSDKTIEIHVKNLRAKSNYIKQHLKTRRGVGYIWE